MRVMLSAAAVAIDGVLHGDDVVFSSVSTDSRTIQPGELFVALKGDNFDGHEYVASAQDRKACAVMVEHPVETDLPQLQVADTRIGLGRLAQFWRRQAATRMVAVTGSNGKTTVKEMTAAILSCCGNVLATQGNLNNDIGVPLTLLKLNESHRFAVIEMGANHPGEIAYLATIAEPDCGVVNNAGAAHLEGFGSLDGVARTKGELFAALGQGGVAILNADDQYAPYWKTLIGEAETLSFGLSASADIGASFVAEKGGSRMFVKSPLGRFELLLPVSGEHNVRNALAAIAASIAMGAQVDDIVAGLSGFSAVAGRLQTVAVAGGMNVVDDSYNANPASLAAALDVLSACEGNRWLVLGDMGELGEDAEKLHREAGRQARNAGVGRMFALGEMSAHACSEFGEGCMHFDDWSDLARTVAGEWSGTGTVLIKGSRFMGMERVARYLANIDKRAQGNGG